MQISKNNAWCKDFVLTVRNLDIKVANISNKVSSQDILHQNPSGQSYAISNGQSGSYEINNEPNGRDQRKSVQQYHFQ